MTVEINPEVCWGQPVIVGTRIPAGGRMEAPTGVEPVMKVLQTFSGFGLLEPIVAIQGLNSN